MTHAELLEEYERRRAEAARVGSTAPLAKVYSLVLEELRALDGRPEHGRMMSTGEAAEVLGVSCKTVRRWIDAGRFPGAVKTSGEAGEWRIPAEQVYQAAGAPAESASGVPRLWSPSDA